NTDMSISAPQSPLSRRKSEATMSAQIQVACPKCRQGYTASTSMMGRNIQCKKCGTTFQLTDKASVPDAAAPVQSTLDGAKRSAVKSSTGGSRPTPASGKPLPEMIGQYKVRKQLGQGTFGVVYLAYHSFLDIQVAVKMLRAEALASAQAV